MMRKVFLIVSFLFSTPVVAGEDQFMFLTPSKNIACQYMLDQDNRLYCVRRDAKRSTDAVPVLNAFIELAKGTATTGPFLGDTWYPDGVQVLAYGKSMSHAGVTCTSRRTGLTCKNKRHGFTINSRKISVY
jgi:hypothetical protein